MLENLNKTVNSMKGSQCCEINSKRSQVKPDSQSFDYRCVCALFGAEDGAVEVRKNESRRETGGSFVLISKAYGDLRQCG